MPHAYAEDQLVEQPAIGLFAEFGWTTVPGLEKTFGATGTLLRETIPFFPLFRFRHQSGIDGMRTLWFTIAP